MSEKKRVLIVDDSEVMRELISDILEKNGFEIAGTASNGIEALDQYSKLKPNMVTMDIVMPREHGIDAVKKIIDLDNSARIIVISGLYQKSLVVDALEAGACDYLIKPFEPNELVDALKKNLT
jgi:two-component system chemotaxis response regulator CheY